mgnify:CR=1 FL=1|tara:strand:- start:836 stop:1411 length:576 start_codon:yes stop_codon:yes gene_type:complete
MKKPIQYDFYRLTGKKPSLMSFIRTLWIPGFRYLFVFRAIQSTRFSILRLFLKFLLRRYQFKFGYQIPSQTKIGRGLLIGHFGRIIINSKVVIGENCNINSGTVIGSTSRGNRKGAPKIGNNVWIGVNSVVVGNISIGNNVLIAPGSYVNIDIPSNSLVMGNPCTVKNKENATVGYINRVYKCKGTQQESS